MISIMLFALMEAIYYCLFGKMGEKQTIGLIPFYNEYVLYQKLWNVKAYFITLALVIAGCGCYGYYIRAKWTLFLLYDRGTILSAIPLLLAIVGILGYLAFRFTFMKRMSEAFGHDKAFAVGLAFLAPIFLGLLAFSANEVYRPIQQEIMIAGAGAHQEGEKLE